MIKKLFSLVAMTFLVALCTSVINNAENLRQRAGTDDDVVFYATIEGQSEAETKVFAVD